MRIDPSFSLLLVAFHLLRVTGASAQLEVRGEESLKGRSTLFRCGWKERCRLIGTSMRKVDTADDSCRDRCIFFASFRTLLSGFECGSCADWEANLPGFRTQLNIDEDVPEQARPPFSQATETWERVITGDIPSVTLTSRVKRVGNCPFRSYPTAVDDIFICALTPDIDGEGAVLGAAAAEFIRDDSGLPITGFMLFDIADVDFLLGLGVFDEVIVHEMGHVYGISRTSWSRIGLVDSTEPPCSYELDSAASREFQSLSGCPANVPIPIENEFGSGTACSHWDEYCVAGELMTGFLSGGLQMSRMTVATLDDLGYTVDYNLADGFSAFNSTCLAEYCGTGGRSLRRAASRRKPKEQRKLSEDSGLQAALAFGQKQLDINARNATALDGSRLDGVKYVGDQSILVYYLDDNNDVQHIEVTPNLA